MFRPLYAAAAAEVAKAVKARNPTSRLETYRRRNQNTGLIVIAYKPDQPPKGGIRNIDCL
jgi:hypothetical protein